MFFLWTASWALAAAPAPDLPPIVITTPQAAVTSLAASPTPLATPTPAHDAEVWDASDEALRVLLASPFVAFEIRPEVAKAFDKESRGRYSAKRRQFRDCRETPLAFVWEEFSPFFGYRWSKEFVNFAALLLAVWERESRFAMPVAGVHVNPNCEGRPAKIAKPLLGNSIPVDLSAAARKDAVLESAFGGCNLRIADFGPLQWNHRWRLSAAEFRPDIERALLLTTSYSPKAMRKLDSRQLASLVKYNPKALFLLGGLSLREGATDPKTTIDAYNTNPEYRETVNARRLEFVAMLKKPGARCTR